MKKWLIIIGYRYMSFWSSLHKLAYNKVRSQQYDKTFCYYHYAGGEYNVLIVDTGGVFGNEYWKMLCGEFCLNNESDIVVYSHEAWTGNKYGCSHEILSDTGYKYQLFHGDNPDKQKNYPLWIIEKVNRSVEIDWLEGVKKVFEGIIWDEIVENAKGSCPKGTKCDRSR